MFFLIKERLEFCDSIEAWDRQYQYVAVVTRAAWTAKSGLFDMGIELDVHASSEESTVAEVNYDSLTGTFSIPDRNNLENDPAVFAFALDEKGVVFIDDSGTAERLVRQIEATRRWKWPSLERFLYDFLELIVHNDQKLLAEYEEELENIEDVLTAEPADRYPTRVNEIRGDLRQLRIHYEQMMDLVQELEENENGFFRQENLRYFRLFAQRMALLHDIAASLRDYTIQLRDLYQTQLDVRQNHIMTVLTVVTTIFMPLTLIVGWYGMNFVYMPELRSVWGYPAVILACLAIIATGIIFFRRKHWL